MVFVCTYSKMWNGKEDLPWQCYRTMCKRIASEFRGWLKIFMIWFYMEERWCLRVCMISPLKYRGKLDITYLVKLRALEIGSFPKTWESLVIRKILWRVYKGSTDGRIYICFIFGQFWWWWVEHKRYRL